MSVFRVFRIYNFGQSSNLRTKSQLSPSKSAGRHEKMRPLVSDFHYVAQRRRCRRIASAQQSASSTSQTQWEFTKNRKLYTTYTGFMNVYRAGLKIPYSRAKKNSDPFDQVYLRNILIRKIIIERKKQIKSEKRKQNQITYSY